MTTQRTRDARRYYAARYWFHRRLAHKMRTEGARMVWGGRAELFRQHWLHYWRKRGEM